MTEQHNAPLEDVQAALNKALLRDGTAPFMANMNANGFRITGLANGTDNADAANLGQLKALLSNTALTGDTTVESVTVTGSASFEGGVITPSLSAPKDVADIQVKSGYRMGANPLYCNQIASDGVSDIKFSAVTRFGDNTIFANSFGVDGAATRTIVGNTIVSNVWDFVSRPIIPVGNVSWYETNAQAVSVGDVLASFLNNFGRAQTSNSPTTFSSGLYVPLGISSTATTNNAVMATGDAFLTFLRVGGPPQSSSSPTSFTNGVAANSLSVGSLLPASGSVDISIQAGARMGGQTLYCNYLYPDGASDLTVRTNFRMGPSILYCNNIIQDGASTRTITGNTNVSDLWNFGIRPSVSGTTVALISDLPIDPSQKTVSFTVNTSSGSWVSFPSGFSDKPTGITITGRTNSGYPVIGSFDGETASGFTLTAQREDRNGSTVVSYAWDFKITATGPK
ncbi:hypothetical protein [Asaia astilbis]